MVAAQLRDAHPGCEVEIIIIQTSGDRLFDASLARIGGKGVFTKEIEDALLDGRIDVAVHSLKDLPTEMAPGLALGAVTRRENPSDMLIARSPLDPMAIPAGAHVGTSSLRRRAQLLRAIPGLRMSELRGNVPTRIGRLVSGDFDAIILAAAGINRLSAEAPFMVPIPHDLMLPAPGQGALGLQCRAGDQDVIEALAPLHDYSAAVCCGAERALLGALGGGCQLPLGTHGSVDDGRLRLRGRVVSPDGLHSCESEITGPPDDWQRLGRELAAGLLARGAHEILAGLGVEAPAPESVFTVPPSPLDGLRVLITRDEDSDGPLSQAIRRLGGEPICVPLVREAPAADSGPLRGAIGSLDSFDWLLVTSVRTVAALRENGANLTGYRGAIAAVGESTAAAVREAGGHVDLVAREQTGLSLMKDLVETGVGPGIRVLYPCSNLTPPTMETALRAEGAEVVRVEAYRTMPAGDRGAVRELLRASQPGAVLFCSASAATAFVEILGAEQAAAMLAGLMVGSIGPRTSEALRAASLPVTFEPEERSFAGLAAALVKRYPRPGA